MRRGVCYYPEHWPDRMWADDARRMAALGLSFVRIGEFAWSRIEPARDRFDWNWLDRAVDTLAAAGVGIPRLTPPPPPQTSGRERARDGAAEPRKVGTVGRASERWAAVFVSEERGER